MLFADPIRLRRERPKNILLFAASQLQGSRPRQEDWFLNFNDECFVVADGVGGMPHGDVAARLACETAVWAYKHVRQRPFYWDNKGLFMKRIFRTTNMRVWHKRRDEGFGDGMATTMLVVVVLDRAVWVASAGDTAAYFRRRGRLTKVTKDDVDREGRLTKALGIARLGLVPRVSNEPFVAGDTALLATDGVANYVDEASIQTILANAGETTQTLTDAVVEFLKTAEKNGSTDNMTAVILKRVTTVPGS